MKQLWNQLPIFGKVLVIILILFIVYKIYTAIKNSINSKKYKTPVNQAQTSLNQLAQQGVFPSFSQTEYSTSANSLEKIFNGCINTSGWDTLKGIFNKLKNEADIYALIIAYGTRTTDRCGIGTGDNVNSDLATTLTDETNTFWQNLPISDVNDILKSKGIVFTF